MAGSSCGRRLPVSGVAPCLLSVERMADPARACSRGDRMAEGTNMGRSVAPERCMWQPCRAIGMKLLTLPRLP